MEIYLIRHTTPLIQKGLIYGHLDVPLAGTFEEEKEKVLLELPPVIDAVYSSPSTRCTRLAAAISPAFQEDEALKELHFGNWEGKTWDTVSRQNSDRWMNDFVHLSPPNGETMLQMEQRILVFWNHLLQQPYQQVAVVTHGGVIRILLARYRAIQLKDAFTIPVALAEVIRLSVSSVQS